MKDLNKDFQKCHLIKSVIESNSTLENIGKKSRKLEIVFLKQLYAKLCHTHTNASLKTIGEVLGNYEHTSILHSIRTFDKHQSINALLQPETYKEVLFELTNTHGLSVIHRK